MVVEISLRRWERLWAAAAASLAACWMWEAGRTGAVLVVFDPIV